MRTKNSFINFLANEGSIVINLILSFIARTVFIYTLSAEYLGVNGLFSNILSVLSLAELGIGTAMLYHLYDPVSRNDTDLQRRLMNLYRRLYMIVASVVLVAGLLLTPFLSYFIKEKNAAGIENLTLIYLLYLLNTVASYLLSYNRSIINAHQKMYVVTLIDTVCTISQFLIQIAVLLIFKDFILYLLVQIAAQILSNIIVKTASDRMYPFLKDNKKDFPDDALKKDIYKNIGAMSLHRFGDVFVNNTDNLIMSAFVGIYYEGIYSNYLLIQTTVYTALNSVFLAVTASIGDLNAAKDENADKTALYEVYRMMYLLTFWMFSLSSVLFMALYNPFIKLWTGHEEYVFTEGVVLLIVINFYFSGMRRLTLTFRDAMGLYWYDRYKPIFESIINLVTSILLVRVIGIAGIFIGTLTSTLTTCFWIEPLVLYKYGFKRGLSDYFIRFIKYTAFLVTFGGASLFIISKLNFTGIPEIIIRAALVLLIYNAAFIIFFIRTEEATLLLEKAKNLIKRNKK